MSHLHPYDPEPLATQAKLWAMELRIQSGMDVTCVTSNHGGESAAVDPGHVGTKLIILLSIRLINVEWLDICGLLLRTPHDTIGIFMIIP